MHHCIMGWTLRGGEEREAALRSSGLTAFRAEAMVAQNAVRCLYPYCSYYTATATEDNEEEDHAVRRE